MQKWEYCMVYINYYDRLAKLWSFTPSKAEAHSLGGKKDYGEVALQTIARLGADGWDDGLVLEPGLQVVGNLRPGRCPAPRSEKS